MTEQRVVGVDVWPYRRRGTTAEFLLLHRVQDDMPPFWQGVSGTIEPGERAVATAVRELREETGLSAIDLYTVDAQFSLYDARADLVSTIVVFAAEVAPGTEPRLSDEHDELRWEPLAGAVDLVPFHPQKHGLLRFSADVLERPEHAHLYRVETHA